MGPAAALFQICHRLNAGGLTLTDETSAALAFTATFFSQCEYHSRRPRFAIDRIANAPKCPGYQTVRDESYLDHRGGNSLIPRPIARRAGGAHPAVSRLN